MDLIPKPSEADRPINTALQTDLSVGEQWSVTFTPEQSGATYRIPTIAVSKVSGTTYEVVVDGTTIYGPAPVPPTDIDDLAVTFVPAQTFDSGIEVLVTNTAGTSSTYNLQVLGWEEVRA